MLVWFHTIINNSKKRIEKMSTTEEKIKIMQAWVDGLDIEYTIRDKNIDGNLVSTVEPVWNWKSHEYRIKQRWHDNIPECGVLCWVSNLDGHPEFSSKIVAITRKLGGSYLQHGRAVTFSYATPLSKDELKAYLSACPK